MRRAARLRASGRTGPHAVNRLIESVGLGLAFGEVPARAFKVAWSITPSNSDSNAWSTVAGLSPADLTTAAFGGSVSVTSSPNSEVLPFGSVAVALIARPGVRPKLKVAEKVALPLEFVITEIEPR